MSYELDIVTMMTGKQLCVSFNDKIIVEFFEVQQP